MRKPTAPEQLYIDFDGFFAACEEQADRQLQGRPLGVIPFAGAVQSCVIAANTMAKSAGVTTGMAIADARRRCPGIALVPQQPDLYTRIHHRIVAAVGVGARMRAGLRASNRRARHLPMRYETGLPSSVIRFRT